MGRAFVIRPFGRKKDAGGKEIDFERVHKELIKPALDANEFEGDTTTEINDSGNIREDMFQLILEADLVVCDLTVHNANVFYELGMRHALRKKRTVLIKGEPTKDEAPFDLLTDRYLVYDVENPAKALPDLTDAIAASEASDRPTDSPIFLMMPRLPEADPEDVLAVPPDFREEVGRAAAAKKKGWLRLLSGEVRGERFERSGLKVVAEAQWKVKDYDGARESWERIRYLYPDDVDANLALANIYERQSRGGSADLLVQSDQAVERVLGSESANRRERAEALALKGRNQKTHWRARLGKAGSLEERRQAALDRSLIESYESYLGAFREDLNHFYPGLTALQMGSILLDLSGDEGWADAFDDDRAAENYRIDLEEEVRRLRAGVSLSVEAALAKLDETDPDLKWARISEADVLFLTSDNDRRVVRAYASALAKAAPFEWDAAKGQLELFEDLGLRPERVQEVIAAVEKGLAEPEGNGRPVHIVVFAGHQIDEPDRKEPRFPPDKVGRARELIKSAIESLMDEKEDIVPLASASPGADILWHEVCDELTLESVICLPMPVGAHAKVVFKDKDAWRSRFLDIVQEKGREVLTLSDQEGLPRWLRHRKLNPWERGNEWVMNMASAWGADKVTLLAFWDGREQGVAPGGTAQAVQLARKAGTVRVQRIDATKLLA